MLFVPVGVLGSIDNVICASLSIVEYCQCYLCQSEYCGVLSVLFVPV